MSAYFGSGDEYSIFNPLFKVELSRDSTSALIIIVQHCHERTTSGIFLLLFFECGDELRDKCNIKLGHGLLIPESVIRRHETDTEGALGIALESR